MDNTLFTGTTPGEGADPEFVIKFLLEAFLPSAFLFGFFLFDILRKKKHTLGLKCSTQKNIKSFQLYPIRDNKIVFFAVLVLGVVGVGIDAEKNIGIFSYFANYVTKSTIFEEEFVEPNDVTLTFPKEKKNLIYILMESGEASNQNKENGGIFDDNYTPEMTQIAKDNISFSQNDLIVGAEPAPATGWTMAGMVSQFSGIPLKFNFDAYLIHPMENFLPGVTTLGEILEKEGYKNYYMIGSDAKFGARDKFMIQHGNYEILDYNRAIEDGQIPEDYKVWWGFEDSKLYEYAKKTITEISKNDEPFNFTMLTVDTHNPDGFICPLCEDEFDEQYANVWACSSRQLNEFINWIKEQPFYENTTIVISGDHCSMAPRFYKGNDGKRTVYNAIVHPFAEPVNEKNRKFTTLDFFPTTLRAMGVDIEGDRLGMGTNLFSARETLSEELGYKKYFGELAKKSEFYNKNILMVK